jgi:acyl carrier protein
MGLDGVELVMSLEEAFGIQITDEEATNCRTPRMVIDVIFSKLKVADERVCRSQRAFYTIRRVLVQTFGLERKSVTPDMRFREFVPKPREKELWEQIKATLGPRNWPGLVRPAWMSLSLSVIGAGVFSATVVAVIHLLWGAGTKDWRDFVFFSAAGGIVLTTLFGIIAAVLTRPYCLYIPAHLASIRDVIPHAVTSDRITGWTREDVAIVVKRLTAEQLGLDESEVTEDSRFVEDLNLDR